MRGAILSFTGQEGVISSQGTQYPFRLDQWKSDQSPAPGQSVEFTVQGTDAVAVTRVDPTQMLEEKGRIWLGQAKTMAENTYRDAGKPITIAYGVFAVFALFADVVRDVPMTLPGLVNGLSWYTLANSSGVNGGFGFLLVLLAILSIAVPVFWQHPAAPLAYTLPLIVTFIGLYNLYSAVSALSGLAGAFDARMGSSVSNHAFNSITLWFWLTFFVAIYLAVMGFRRYRANKASANPV